MRILVVDDSEAFRRVMTELLMKAGYGDVRGAGGYEEALAAYAEARPDIVFVDMVLPGRSGVDLTKAILGADPKARIIAMSSIVNKSMIKESLEAGAKDFILKPTNAMALGSILSMWGG
ncbi:MAG: response regulator [Candidatus Thermoplasmatota archaeon]